jgi:hypothetical protein
MFNWFKKKGKKETQKEESAPKKEQSTPQNQERNNQQTNNNVTGNVDLGSCTLANMIHNLMPKDFFPQLNQAQVGFKDNVVTIGIGNHKIEIICKELGIQPYGQFIAGSYSIITKLDNGKELYEEVPGYGNEAIRVYYGAAQNYVAGFLHGYLAAIFGMFDEGYDLQNDSQDMWHVSLGNYLLQGKLQEMEMPEGQLFDIILPKMDDFKSKMRDEIYGIKIYMSQVNGNEFVGDCRIDNVEWQEGINELKEKDYSNWVQSNDLMSKKQWIFLKKCKKEN